MKYKKNNNNNTLIDQVENQGGTHDESIESCESLGPRTCVQLLPKEQLSQGRPLIWVVSRAHTCPHAYLVRARANLGYNTLARVRTDFRKTERSRVGEGDIDIRWYE